MPEQAGNDQSHNLNLFAVEAEEIKEQAADDQRSNESSMPGSIEDIWSISSC